MAGDKDIKGSMKKKLLALVFILLSLIAIKAEAFVLGGSNFSLYGYADHSCYKPSKPYKPFQFYTDYEIDSYNSAVRQYNAELDLYIGCIKEYIENAENDIERIKEKIQETIDEAKRPY